MLRHRHRQALTIAFEQSLPEAVPPEVPSVKGARVKTDISQYPRKEPA